MPVALHTQHGSSTIKDALGWQHTLLCGNKRSPYSMDLR